MPNWISITADDLNDTKVAALVSALRTAALAAGQDDPIEEITANVVARIRAEIASCVNNRLDEDTTTIPKSLKSLAARMIVREMQSRLRVSLKEDERDEQKNDLRYLERIARCEVTIDSPDNPIQPQVETGGAVEIASKTTRNCTREKMRGL